MEHAGELSVSTQLDVYTLRQRELDEIQRLGDGRGDVHGEEERESSRRLAVSERAVERRDHSECI